MKVLRFGMVLEVNGYSKLNEFSLLLCISVADFFNRNLFESPTNNMPNKIILKISYLPKFILKLHLDDNLQVTLVYYLYFKRDINCC